MGYLARNIKSDEELNDMIDVVATFSGSAIADHKRSLMGKENQPYKQEEEFVAIAEGRKLPIYIFTYNIEMTQFIYTNIMVSQD